MTIVTRLTDFFLQSVQYMIDTKPEVKGYWVSNLEFFLFGELSSSNAHIEVGGPANGFKSFCFVIKPRFRGGTCICAVAKSPNHKKQY